jgi:hypothetical protein
MTHTLTVWLTSALLATPQLDSPIEPHVPASTFREAWKALPVAKSNTCLSSVLASDPWPDGGIRNFYCHVIGIFPWQTFTRIAARRIFLRGPHSQQKLDLHNPTHFGHYDPVFVDWLVGAAVPAATDPQFKAETQRSFDLFLRPLARTYYAVYGKMQTRPDWVETKADQYLAFARTGEALDLIASAQGGARGLRSFSELSSFMSSSGFSNPPQEGDSGGYDPSLQRAAVLFWLRRTIDKTALRFFLGLRTLLATYDRAWLEKTQAELGSAPLEIRSTH